MAVKRVKGSLLSHASKRGRLAGYRLGWSHGLRYGKSEAVIRSQPPQHLPVRDFSVLLVTSGMGYPFSPIDHAVTNAMKKQVRKLQVCSPKDDIVAVAAQFRPTLVIVLLGTHMPVTTVASLKLLGIKTAIWYSDDPYYTDTTRNTAIYYDFVFTNELSCVEFYRQVGCKHVYHMPLAVDLNAFRPMKPKRGYYSDICFIGSAYWYRVEFFNKIAPYLIKQDVKIFGWWWQRLSLYSRLARSIRTEWLSPEETARYYNGAKIVINLHRSPDDETFNKNSSRVAALSTNPRTFEICGTGAFQLTDARLDLPSHYTPGHDLITYTSAEDLVNKLNYYLEHEEERNQIALNGLKKTVRDHTFDQRVRALLSILTERLVL